MEYDFSKQTTSLKWIWTKLNAARSRALRRVQRGSGPPCTPRRKRCTSAGSAFLMGSPISWLVYRGSIPPYDHICHIGWGYPTPIWLGEEGGYPILPNNYTKSRTQVKHHHIRSSGLDLKKTPIVVV